MHATNGVRSSRKRAPVFFVMLPGNPGAPSCYERFLSVIADRTASYEAPFHILTIGHAGHTVDTATSTRYSLSQQLEHKRLILSRILFRYPTAKFILAGHSIGAYMVTELMRALPPSSVLQGICLTPTLSHIGRSANGVKLTPLFRYGKELAWLAVSGIAALPTAAQRAVLTYFVKEAAEDEHTLKSLMPLVHPHVPVNALQMALHEMQEVGALDEAHITQHADKLVFFFAQKDDWVADSDADAIERLCGGRSKVVRCAEGHTHAFVLSAHSSERLGLQTWGWISEALSRHSHNVNGHDAVVVDEASGVVIDGLDALFETPAR